MTTHEPPGGPDAAGRPEGTAAAVRTLAGDLSALVRAELALAKAELAAGAKAKARGGGLLAAAGTLAGVAGLALLVALGFALVELAGLPGWASALVVAALLLAAAAVLALLGRKALASPVGVETTKASIREDVARVRGSLRR